MEIGFMQMGMFLEIPLIKSLNFSNQDVQVISKHLKLQQFKKGEKILQCGEEETLVRFVQKGLIREFYVYQNREINTRFASCNDVVCSFSSFMSQEPSTNEIEAMADTTTYTLTREGMNQMYVEGGAQFIKFGRKIFSDVCKQKALREMELVNDDALGRLQNFLSTKPELFAQIPQKQLASYLNITPETFSNLKRKLRYPDNSGIIKFDLVENGGVGATNIKTA